MSISTKCVTPVNLKFCDDIEWVNCPNALKCIKEVTSYGDIDEKVTKLFGRRIQTFKENA